MTTETTRTTRDFAAEAYDGSPADALELAAAAGGAAEIAGKPVPTPTAAAVALLDALGSPFVTDAGRDVNYIDVARALYVIAAREKAALPALRVFRRREMAEPRGDGDDDLALATRLGAAERLADAEADFDRAAVDFLASLGPLSLAAASRDIARYLALCSGFEMLPEDPDAGKKKAGATSTT